MFDQLMKRSNAVWIYKTGRFAEERRAFLCDLNEKGHSMQTLRNVNRFLLVIAERVNVRQSGQITGSADRAGSQELGREEVMRAELHSRNTRDAQRKRFIFVG